MFACIDLGSNSFHLLIARQINGKHEIVERFSEKVQLGAGLMSNGLIQPDAFERGLACLKDFAAAMEAHPVKHIWAVGTNALRVAKNSADFLAAAAELGIDIDVVSGEEEAALVYTGVSSALPVLSESQLVVDIGGGSTEVVIGRGMQRDAVFSLPIGCVSWRDKWFADVAHDAHSVTAQLSAASEDARQVFGQAAEQLSGKRWLSVRASSGTAKMLSQICTARESGNSSAEGVSLDTLQSLQGDVVRTAIDPEYELPGLKPSRRELVLPGWSVLLGFMQAFHVETLAFSPAALREGMLYYMREGSLRNEAPLHVLKAS
ncbi:hypothetical protein GCM10011403_14050 [Pseudohongiella nitratireducens]|uniref:Ppx/GppA phosphatase N-terminal domain-containing protein n=1 Tax=Pseudohongiella nitratireducens TaxID=1768907 RepID=A0A917LUL7_9GAMM|nr:Ppx/GppA family phosphatase [Pseudohongiella nitratireducens]MDF1623078.1 Ppx/GppA family phosphatase [Pseudohongiella nitratireducens]GGG57924.1 hypothetical protein GCM10011403_14050 [Pseudohongiella nitratireducens]